MPIASGSTSSSRRSQSADSPARRSRRTTRTPSARPRPRPAPTATCPRPTTTTRSWRSCSCTGPTSSTSSASTRGSAKSDHIEAVQVTEWEEPQAVIGSYLHRYAYPDWFAAHEKRGRELVEAHDHGTPRPRRLPAAARRISVRRRRQRRNARLRRRLDREQGHLPAHHHRAVLATRAQHPHPFDERDLRRACRPTSRSRRSRTRASGCESTIRSSRFHPIYNYALITDAGRGLILVDVNTLQDGEARNNFLERALTWNGGGVLKGARHVTIGGYYAYIAADAGMVDREPERPAKPEGRGRRADGGRPRDRRCSSAICS